MTVRRRVLSRKSNAEERLPVNVELWAAAMLAGFWWVSAMSTRRWWLEFASVHGARLEAKVREACPGCRPGFMYATGKLPPLPFIEEPPPEHTAARQFVTIDGERLYWCAPSGDRVWLRCQAEHLRDAGEIDGREWRDYLRWRDEGFPARYRISGGNRTIVGLRHLCN